MTREINIKDYMFYPGKEYWDNVFEICDEYYKVRYNKDGYYVHNSICMMWAGRTAISPHDKDEHGALPYYILKLNDIGWGYCDGDEIIKVEFLNLE